MPTATMATSAVRVSALPPVSISTATLSLVLDSLLTLAPTRNFSPRRSKDFWAAAEISASSTGTMRSSISTTVTSAPKAL